MKISKFSCLIIPLQPPPPYATVPTFFLVSDITVLLSLTVFHNIVADTLPQVSDSLPVIGSCCGLCTMHIPPYTIHARVSDPSLPHATAAL